MLFELKIKDRNIYPVVECCYCNEPIEDWTKGIVLTFDGVDDDGAERSLILPFHARRSCAEKNLPAIKLDDYVTLALWNNNWGTKKISGTKVQLILDVPIIPYT